MSDGALSQEDVNKIIKGEIDLNKAVSQSDGDIPKEDLSLLLNAINVYEQKQTKNFSLESRQLKFTNEQLNKIAIVFGNFAQRATDRLSTILRCAVNIQVNSINQLTVGEVSLCIPTPTTLGFINTEPLKGDSVIEVDPNITFAIIDIVNHGRTGVTKSYSEFTNNEVTIINNLFSYILESMKVALSGIINIQPKLYKLETDPKTIKIAPVSEMTVLISLAVNIIGTDGMINFCIPFPVIEPILEKL